MTVVETVRAAYLSNWGDPARRAEFSVEDYLVEVYKWDAETIGEGVNLYATIGSSLFPIADSDPTHRVEYFVGLRPAKDEIASPLAALALYAVRERVHIGHGDIVRADVGLWIGTEMRWFLVLRPIVQIIAPVAMADGVHVEFMQAVPIFESERAYKARHGADALLRLWEDCSTPFWNPDRSAQPESG